MWWIVILLVLYMLFDVHYFIWGIVYTIRSLIRIRMTGKHDDLFSTISTWAICTTTDLDFVGHMNNARYLRNGDFARYKFWISTGIWSESKKRGGLVLLGGSTIRYRRSLELFQPYRIEYRILCWDDKAFYLEQKHVRCKDNFICSIAFLKQVFLKVTPPQLVEAVTGKKMESPEFPEEVKLWIESNNISSQNLRKDN